MEQFIGIGLRHPHYVQVLAEKPALGWLEVHPENFMQEGGPSPNLLFTIREHYPLSFHGVGLSLGSAQGLRILHLKRLKKLIDEYDPFLVSDHLSWSYTEDTFLPDLLPIPYTEEALQIFADNIDKAQNFLQRTLLIENPSSYIEYQASTYSETEFLNALIKHSGAKLLLDVNNVYVSCYNHGWNTKSYLQALNPHSIQEIHLSGHSIKQLANQQILRIDTHGNFVCTEVWELYAMAIHLFGPSYTLLEWDQDIPALSTLIQEAHKALPYLAASTENIHAIA